MSVPVLPRYLESFDTSLYIIGIIAGIGPFVSLFTRPFSGILSDRFHQKRLFMLFAFLTGLTILGYSVTQNTTLLLILRILNGIVFAICGTVIFAWAAQVIPHQQIGEGIGYLSLSQILASAVGPSLGLMIADRMGYISCFRITFLVSLTASLLALAAHYTPSGNRKPARSLHLRDFLAVELLPFTLLAGPFSLANSLIMTYIAMMGAERGIANIGLYFIINAAALILVRPFAGRLYDKKGLAFVLIPAYLIEAVALACAALAPSMALISVAAILRALGQGVGQPSIQAECIRIYGKERSGTATSTYYIGNDAFQGFGSMAGGAVIDQYGYTALYLGGSAFALLGLAGFLLMRKKTEHLSSPDAD